jgi:hypothetical protein
MATVKRMRTCFERPYEGQAVAFLTQHGKQDLVRDELQAALGCVLVHTDEHDTDQLGTFTRDIDRLGSQLAAAKKKIELGMALTGARVGMGSEGAFSMDPFTHMMPWNTEIVHWTDLARGIEVTGWAHGSAKSLHRSVKTIAQLEQFAAEASFPSHHLVVRPDHASHPDIHKGLKDTHSLHQAFEQALANSLKGVVFVENDLRAFCNPTRQAIIRKAVQDLIDKLLSACPSCTRPGFVIKQKIPGLPCLACGAKTRLPIAEIWHCQVCKTEEERPVNQGELANPSRCEFCNP